MGTIFTKKTQKNNVIKSPQNRTISNEDYIPALNMSTRLANRITPLHCRQQHMNDKIDSIFFGY